MSTNDKSHKTEIIIAFIGVFGALGGALIANWDKVFPQKDGSNDQKISEVIEREGIAQSEIAKRVERPPKQVTQTRPLPQQVITYDTNTSNELESFVRLYLDILGQCNLSEILSLYGDDVDYFDIGRVNKNTIREDKENYCKRWPTIQYELKGRIVSQDTNDEKIKLVEFPISFYVYSSQRSASMSGIARNSLKIQKLNGELKIIDEKQKLLSREKH